MRTNLTIFLLFFGIALLDAIRGGYWVRILFWSAVAAVFLLADRRQLVRRRAAKPADIPPGSSVSQT